MKCDAEIDTCEQSISVPLLSTRLSQSRLLSSSHPTPHNTTVFYYVHYSMCAVNVLTLTVQMPWKTCSAHFHSDCLSTSSIVEQTAQRAVVHWNFRAIRDVLGVPASIAEKCWSRR